MCKVYIHQYNRRSRVTGAVKGLKYQVLTWLAGILVAASLTKSAYMSSVTLHGSRYTKASRNNSHNNVQFFVLV